ncbi:tetratricopeptide repeat protein [Shivajiella indica]|uniref:Tetratricopeptide repeat protein n=1 Tax=Shivajiella indica TaxID=872115 RepID=A0ABW5B6M9_9BACT
MSNFDISIQYFKEGKFQEALEQINICIEEEKNNSEFYFFRARVKSRLGDFHTSLEDFDYLIQLEPFNPTYISDRAVVLHLLQRNEEALEEFDRALNLEPSNPYRYSSRAYFKDRIGDLKGAIEDYEKAIELDPEDAVAYNNKGLVEEKLGYIEKSKKSFKKADELVGYNPGKMGKPEIDQDSNTGSKLKTSFVEDSGKGAEGQSSLTFSDYLGTVKKVFKDQETRKEFWEFLKSRLSGNKL